MTLRPIQTTSLNFWNAIQDPNIEKLNLCLSKDFKGTFYGKMNGEKNEITVNKDEMILMCHTTGIAAKALASLQFNYSLGKDEEDQLVYIVKYNQELVFEPTAVLSPVEEQLSRMLSRGVQVYKWIINEDGKAEITSMLGYEVDETQPIKEANNILETTAKLKNMFSIENFQKVVLEAGYVSSSNPFSSSNVRWEALRTELLQKEVYAEIELPQEEKQVEPPVEKNSVSRIQCVIA